MAKRKFEDEIDDLALRTYYRRYLVPLTETYRNFKLSLRSRFDFKRLRLKGVGLEAWRGPFLSAWQDEHDLIKMFSKTAKGKYVVGRSIEIRKRAISLDRELFDEKRLNICLDLSFSKEQLRQDFEYILKEYHHKVKQTSRVRGDSQLTCDEIGEAINFFKMVKKHDGNIQRAMWEMFPETEKIHPSYDRNVNQTYQRLTRLYQRVENDLARLEFPSQKKVVSENHPPL